MAISYSSRFVNSHKGHFTSTTRKRVQPVCRSIKKITFARYTNCTRLRVVLVSSIKASYYSLFITGPISNMKSRSVHRLYRFVIVTFLVACMAYGIAWPTYTTYSAYSKSTAKTVDQPPAENETRTSAWANDDFREALGLKIRIRLLDIFGVLWLFGIGASFGSFMNVVVYRLPLGRTLVGRSFCPRCDQAIHALDNIPVLGWLRLGGECRSCGLPISSRYPLVELLAGVLFLALAIVELVLGGVNLPLEPPVASWGFAELILSPNPLLAAVFLYHATLVLVLLTAALIEYDGHRFPPSLFIFGLLVGSLVAAFGWLHIEPWIESADWSQESIGWLSGVVEFAVSILAAFAFGYVSSSLISVLKREMGVPDSTQRSDHKESSEAIFHNTLSFQSPLRLTNPRWEPRATPPLPTQSTLAPLMLTGLFLGWGSLLWILIGAAVFRLAVVAAASAFRWKRPVPATADILFGTLFFLFGWRWLALVDEQLAADHLLWLAPAVAVVVIVFYAVLLLRSYKRVN